MISGNICGALFSGPGICCGGILAALLGRIILILIQAHERVFWRFCFFCFFFNHGLACMTQYSGLDFFFSSVYDYCVFLNSLFFVLVILSFLS